MDRRAAGALLALAACFACSAAAPTASNQTALDLYDGAAEGCYYNFQHYGEGDRIMTNEPCLNCTCHNRMLMCYLRVCPFTKAIGQDCTVEKRADQCCPIVTCPDVPVDLLTSTSTTSPAEYGATGLGKLDKYGCSIKGKYFPEGSKVPPTPNKPCEHCYCIRNMTTCVMQECTLHVDGCTPIYHKDVCCPVRYSCDHPEDELPLLDDMSTTVRPTPGFLLTTTTLSPVTMMTQDCVHDDRVFSDGALIKTEKACEHCYCMKGDIVCVVQECGAPMENEGKNCTSLPPREGQCCPDTYICEGDELTSDLPTESTTESIIEKLTTLSPPRRTSVEGSGYRNEPDETPYTDLPIIEPDVEGSGEEETPKPLGPDEIIPTPGEDDQYIYVTTKGPDYEKHDKTTIADMKDKTIEPPVSTNAPTSADKETLTTSVKEDISGTKAPETYESATTELGDSQNTVPDVIPDEEIAKRPEYTPGTTIVPSSESESQSPIESEDGKLTSAQTSKPELEKETATPSDVSNVTPEVITVTEYSDGDITRTTSATPVEESPVKEDKETSKQEEIVPGTTSSPVKEEKESSKPEELAPSTTSSPTEEEKDSSKPEELAPTSSPAEKEKQSSKPEELAPSTTSSPSEEEKESSKPEELAPSTTSSPAEEEKESSKPEQPAPITTSSPHEEEKLTTEPDHAQNTVAVSEEEITHPHLHITTVSPSEKESTTVSKQEQDLESDKVTKEDVEKQTDHVTTAAYTEKEIQFTTAEPDRGLNTIPSEVYEETSSEPSLPARRTTLSEETKGTEPSVITDEMQTQGIDIKSTVSELTTPLPESIATKGDQFTITTEPSFRKEDEGVVSTEKPKDIGTTTVKSEFVDEGLIPTSPHEDKIGTSSDVPTTEEEFATLVPEYITEIPETVGDKQTTTEANKETSVITDISPGKVSEPSFEQDGDLPTSTEKLTEITTLVETHEEPSRIPGEGDCLLNGVTYKNNTVVPSTNNCHTGCRCASSIIRCDPIVCSPPPDYMDNCQSIYDSPDSCCPTFVCDHPRETAPPQSDNQMSGTESPIPTPTSECRGDQCETIEPTKQPLGPSEPCTSGNCLTTGDHKTETECGSDGCGDLPQKPDILMTSDDHTAECSNGKCKPESCADGKCQSPPTQVSQVAPCEGEHCEKTEEVVPDSPQQCKDGQDCKTFEIPTGETTPCEGESCKKIDCGSGGCGTDTIASLPDDQPQSCKEEDGCKPENIPALECTGDEPCRRKETSTSDAKPPTCEGPDCISEKETIGGHGGVDISTELPKSEATPSEDKTTEPDVHVSKPIDEKIPVKDTQDTDTYTTEGQTTEAVTSTYIKEEPTTDEGATEKITTDVEKETEMPVTKDKEDKEKPIPEQETKKPTMIEKESTEMPVVIKEETTEPAVLDEEDKKETTVDEEKSTKQPTLVDDTGTEKPTMVGDKEKPDITEKESTEVPTVGGEEITEEPSIIDKEKPVIDEDVTKEPTVDDDVDKQKPVIDEESTKKPDIVDEIDQEKPVVDEESTKQPDIVGEDDKEKHVVDEESTKKPDLVDEESSMKPDIVDEETTDKPEILDEDGKEKPMVDEDSTKQPEIVDEDGKEKPVIDKDDKEKHVIDEESTRKPDIVHEDDKDKPVIDEEITKKPHTVDDEDEEKTVVDEKTTKKPDVVDEDDKEKPVVDEESTKRPEIVDEEITKKPDIVDEESTKKPDLVDEESTKKSDTDDEESTKKPDIVDEESTKKTDIVDEESTKKTDIVDEESTKKPDIVDEESTKKPDIVDEESTKKPEIVEVDGTTKSVITEKEFTTMAGTEEETTDAPGIIDQKTTDEPVVTGIDTEKPTLIDEDGKDKPVDTEKDKTDKPLITEEVTEKPSTVYEEGKPSDIDMKDTDKPGQEPTKETGYEKPDHTEIYGTDKPEIDEEVTGSPVIKEETTAGAIVTDEDEKLSHGEDKMTEKPTDLEEIKTEAPVLDLEDGDKKPAVFEQDGTEIPTVHDKETTDKPLVGQDDKTESVLTEPESTDKTVTSDDSEPEKAPEIEDKPKDKPDLPEGSTAGSIIVDETPDIDDGTEEPASIDKYTEKPAFVDEDGKEKPTVVEIETKKPIDIERQGTELPVNIGEETTRKPDIIDEEDIKTPDAEEDTIKPFIIEEESTALPDITKEEGTAKPVIIDEGTEEPTIVEKEGPTKPDVIETEGTELPSIDGDEGTEKPVVTDQEIKEKPETLDQEGTKKPEIIGAGTEKPGMSEDGTEEPSLIEEDGKEKPVDGESKKPILVEDKDQEKPLITDEEGTVKPTVDEVVNTEEPKITAQPTESTISEVEKITKTPYSESETTVAGVDVTSPQETPEIKVTESEGSYSKVPVIDDHSRIPEVATETLSEIDMTTKTSISEHEKITTSEQDVEGTTLKVDTIDVKEEGSTVGQDLISEEPGLFTQVPESHKTTGAVEKSTEKGLISEQEEVSTDTSEIESPTTKLPDPGSVSIEPQDGIVPDEPEVHATSKIGEDSTTKVYEDKIKPTPESHEIEASSASPEYNLEVDEKSTQVPIVEIKTDYPGTYTSEKEIAITETPEFSVTEPVRFTEIEDPSVTGQEDIATGYPAETTEHYVPSATDKIDESGDAGITSSEKPMLIDMDSELPDKPIPMLPDQGYQTPEAEKEKPIDKFESPPTEIPIPVVTEAQQVSDVPEKVVTSYEDRFTTISGLPDDKKEGIEITQHATESYVTEPVTETSTKTIEPEIKETEPTEIPKTSDKEGESETRAPEQTHTESYDIDKKEPTITETQKVSTDLPIEEVHTDMPVVQVSSEVPQSLVTEQKESLGEQTTVSSIPKDESSLKPELITTQPEDISKVPEKHDQEEIQTDAPIYVTEPVEITTKKTEQEDKITQISEDATAQQDTATTLREAPAVTEKTEPIEIMKPTEHISAQTEVSETTPYLIELEEHTHKIEEDFSTASPIEGEHSYKPVQDTSTSLPSEEEHSQKPAEDISTSSPTEEEHSQTPAEETVPSSPSEEEQTSKPINEISTSSPSEGDGLYKPVEGTSTSSPSDEEYSHKPVEEYTPKIEEHVSTVPSFEEKPTTVQPEAGEEHQISEVTTKKADEEIDTVTKEAEGTTKSSEESLLENATEKVSETTPAIIQGEEDKDIADHKEYTTAAPTQIIEESTPVIATEPEKLPTSESDIARPTEKEITTSEKPLHSIVPSESTTPEEEFIFPTTKATTIRTEEDIATSVSDEKPAKPEEKPSETSEVPPSRTTTEVSKPILPDLPPTDEIPVPDDDGHFPTGGTSGYGEPDYVEEDQAFGPGTCRYGGKVYVSAQQIPRDDPCDFCFCFRSDIICLQQSCPPPIHGCHEEPIQGFCCPRYECPVSMATTVNVTTTTTTTTTTLPPHFPTHSYKGQAQRRGCQIKGHTYKVGEVVRSSSGPCLHCTCGGDGQMKCDPKACTPEPMLRQMIAAAVSAKRRR
ncbi:hypothetical protein PYW08_003850 [Mythimna loreyi]|uniref:Uncharacterized protein n=1 Tax=Mythimna loreyi TaxID=667449 RepID=A0ACC2QUW5_9NEOP|nr:hypothetical protein PYW08_003850 [Mythimna loreyi]